MLLIPSRASSPRMMAAPDLRLPDSEWRARLSAREYEVLRREGTEPAWSHEFNALEEEGVFTCAACATPLFRSQEKFDSGSGWPSFWAPAGDDAVITSVDFKLGLPRTEVRCAACDGHLGTSSPTARARRGGGTA